MLQADGVTKLLQQFGKREEASEKEAFIGMIGVTGQDEPDESTS